MQEQKRKNGQEFVKIINRLINESFGEEYTGNEHVEIAGHGILGKLGYIARSKPLFYMLNNTCAGRFTSPDGSEMEVLPRYLEQSKKYAELYKQELGKDVKIRVVKKLDLVD